MAFKDYENLDATKETASEEELRKLRKKYGVDYKYVMGIREIVLSLIISLILTVAIIVLYCNAIKLSIDMIVGMFIPYFFIVTVVVSSIFCIVQKINTKFYVSAVLFGIDALICMTTLLIANMVSIGGTILPIVGMTSFILFFPLGYMLLKSEQKK